MLPEHLPSSDTPSLELLVVPGAAVREYDADPTVADAVSATDADAVLPVPPHENVVAQRLLHAVEQPVLRADRGMRPSTVATPDGELVVVVAPAPAPDTLPETPADLGPAETTPRRVVVVSNAFEMRVVPRNRETVLDGLAAYLAEIPDAWQPSPDDSAETPAVVHASTMVEAGHTTTQQLPAAAAGRQSGTGSRTADPPGSAAEVSVDVLGVGQASNMGAAADTTSHDLLHTTLYASGHVTTTPLDPGNFGLHAVEQVGDARADTLRSHGVRTVTQLRDMSVDAVANTLDTGQATARTVTTSAEALTTGTIVRTSAASLPDDPVFIDIETDGLGASVAWLVGVLDGGSDSDAYYPFRQQTPGDPTAHLEGFATWLQGISRSRPLVAWNGYGFDFDILTEQFREHCPDRLEEWESRRTFDPLYWARNSDNAVLPGRSNRLEAVAEAIGWEPQTSGVDGETAATIYTRWRDAATTADPGEDIPEPDWGRLEAYCEDDVRALATIYEAIGDAPLRTAGGEDDVSTGRQGSLSDFS